MRLWQADGGARHRRRSEEWGSGDGAAVSAMRESVGMASSAAYLTKNSCKACMRRMAKGLAGCKHHKDGFVRAPRDRSGCFAFKVVELPPMEVQ